MTDQASARIARLNDQCRQAVGIAGRMVQTPGISALPAPVQSAIREKVETYTDFSPGNDPVGSKKSNALESSILQAADWGSLKVPISTYCGWLGCQKLPPGTRFGSDRRERGWKPVDTRSRVRMAASTTTTGGTGTKTGTECVIGCTQGVGPCGGGVGLIQPRKAVWSSCKCGCRNRIRYRTVSQGFAPPNRAEKVVPRAPFDSDPRLHLQVILVHSVVLLDSGIGNQNGH